MDRELKILGIVDSRSRAESVIDALHGAGFPLDRISALLSDRMATADFAHDHNTRYPEGAVDGAASGSVVGGALGLLAGIGLFAIPGLGPFIGAGPLVAALGGVAFGGLAGALIGFGVPEMHARTYERELHTGRMLLVIHVADASQAARAIEILTEQSAQHVRTVLVGE
jgi:hypothetical protein